LGAFILIADLLNASVGGDTTAQSVVRYLAEKGISRAAIGDEHLKALYSALSKSAHTSLGRGIQVLEFNAIYKPVDDAVWGVIVETREHPSLEYVVCQFSNQLDIGIQLFHGKANESFIRGSKISSLIEQGKVILTPLDVETFSLEEYNALFLSKRFWNVQMGRKKILVFQADAVLCERSDYQLTDFLYFDYIGSKWPRMRPAGMIIDGGNGGLSLRDLHKSVECLNRFPAELWPGGEDGYFAFHMDLMGARIGRNDECARFSTQYEFLYRSFAGHSVTQLEPSSLDRFIQYCPEVKHTL